MPPKRSKTPEGANISACKTIRVSKKAGWPSLEDADTVLRPASSSSTALRLHKAALIRHSAYFEKVAEQGWPDEFAIKKALSDSAEDRLYVPVTGVYNQSQLGSIGPHTSTPPALQAQNEDNTVLLQLDEACAAFFGLFYHIQPTFGSQAQLSDSPRVVHELARLAALYGCDEVIRDQVLLIIHTDAHLGPKAVSRCPYEFLIVACHLNDKTLFLQAMKFAAGRHFSGVPMPVDDDSHNERLRTLVEQNAQSLKHQVYDAVWELEPSTRMVDWDMPALVANGAFAQYLTIHVFNFEDQPLQLYMNLKGLYDLYDEREMIKALGMEGTVQKLHTMKTNFVDCNRAFRELNDMLCDCIDEDDNKEIFTACNNGQDTSYDADRNCPSTAMLHNALRTRLGHAKTVLRPLFADDLECGHFVLLDCKGDYPWMCDDQQ